MESTNSTMDLAYSFYSESTNSTISLNKAMLMSVDDNTLNSDDNSCYHSYIEEQNETFEHTDSTNLKPLPNFTIDSNLEQENSDNLEDTQHIEEENHESYIPLRTLLRNMFEEILGKYNGIGRQSNVSSINRSTNSSDNSMDNWDNEVNNNLFICQTQKSNKSNIVVTTVDNVKDPDKIIALSSQRILDSRSINTILENSNESSSNSQINDLSSKWSGRLIDKLRNFASHRREKKYRNHVLITSDISNESTSSSISSDVKKVTEEIFQKANNLSTDDPLKLKSNDVTPNNEKELKSPIKKQSIKRRSVSLPKYLEDEETEQQNEKISINNSQKIYTSPYIRNRSNYISTSPIKPVKYLRQYFANLDNKKNVKRSPMLNKYIRRHRIPYIRVIPATPK